MLRRHALLVTKEINSKGNVTIFTGKKCALPNSVQEFTVVEASLVLTFSICLHNHLSSIHSVVTY